MPRYAALLLVSLLLGAPLARPDAAETPSPKLDVPYEPSHPDVVEAMLELAQVGPQDIVYDLGCGDGRIVVAAARDLKARGVGIDLDPQRIRESRENAERAGVADQVRFAIGDIMEAEFGDASVVALYLWPGVNVRLRPLLFRQLQPGTRVVSHDHDMAEWKTDRTMRHEKATGGEIHFWVMPAASGGTWRWRGAVGKQEIPVVMTVEQEFQQVSAELSLDGGAPVNASLAQLNGTRIRLAANGNVAGKPVTMRCSGTVEGDRITGTQAWQVGEESAMQNWEARREAVDPVGTWQVRAAPSRLPAPEGRLIVRRGPDNRLAAQYVVGDAGQELWHFYAWGAGLRFDVPVQGAEVSFWGLIEGDTMRGTVGLVGRRPRTVQWAATRVSG